jgi:hypothetical protein
MSAYNFLPDGHEMPKAGSGSNYFKPQDGQTTIRIMSPKAVTGWEVWVEEHGTSKPKRFKNEGDAGRAGGRDKKYFWAFEIWNYELEKIQIWQINQRTIQDSLLLIFNNPVWGNPMEYDIVVGKTGKALDTKYTVQAIPHKPRTEQMDRSSIEASPNFELLFEGKDPFEG